MCLTEICSLGYIFYVHLVCFFLVYFMEQENIYIKNEYNKLREKYKSIKKLCRNNYRKRI